MSYVHYVCVRNFQRLMYSLTTFARKITRDTRTTDFFDQKESVKYRFKIEKIMLHVP